MKLAYSTDRFGDRITISFRYGLQHLFFAGRQPPAGKLLLLDLPTETATALAVAPPTEAASSDDLSLFATYIGEINDNAPLPAGYLAEWLTRASFLQTPQQIPELPEHLWRPATLDDLLEVQNFSSIAWEIDEYFDLAAFRDFGARYLPEVQERLQLLRIESAAQETIAHLQTERQRLERLLTILKAAPDRLAADILALQYHFDQVLIEALKQQPFTVERWLAVAPQITTLGDFCLEFARLLVQQTVDRASLEQTIRQLAAIPRLCAAIAYDQPFWEQLRPYLALPATVSGEEIDITQAREEVIHLNLALFEGRRVGAIRPERSALVVRAEDGKATYIAGQRKLKFQVARAGGRLERYQNTLIMGDQNQNELHTALLEVELLDTLANVDPPQALARIAHLNLPADHPVFQAATAAGKDARQARILSDLLIELTIGIDADIARQLVRTPEPVSRRRRRR